MIGIHAIGFYVPQSRVSNYAEKARFQIEDDFIRDKIGVEHRSIKSSDEDTSDLCVRAFDDLRAKTNISVEEIDCVIVCTQNPDGQGLPHVSAIVHGKLGLSDRVAAFDISLGCSGYVYGLSVMTSFMQANGLRSGLLFTADPYSKVVDPDDKNTSLLFGDAATVTWVAEKPIFALEKTFFGTRGKDAKALQCVERKLQMNGRAVFSFAMTVVPPQLYELLKSGGYSIADIDLFLFHQGSKYIVDMLTRRLELPPGKVPLKLRDQGNTVSSSIPLILEEYLNRTDVNRVALSGFGVGLSWASALLRRVAS